MMLPKSLTFFIAAFLNYSSGFCQTTDTVDVTDNEKIIVTSNARKEGNVNVNFILFDAQYLNEPFLGTVEYWSFFEDVQLNYNVVGIVQKHRSKYNDTAYINYLYDEISKVIESKPGFNVLVSHSAGSFFSFNLLNKKLPVDACILISPALNDYPVENVNLSGAGKVYISSSTADSFGHDKYFKALKRDWDTRNGERKFELFKDLSHITLFQPSVYNGLSHIFRVFLDYKVDYRDMEFSPRNFNKMVSAMYKTDNIVLSDDQYFFHYLAAGRNYGGGEQLSFIDEYLKMEPNSINFLFAKGDILYNRKMYKDALVVYEQGLEECKKQGAWNLEDFEEKVIRTKKQLMN